MRVVFDGGLGGESANSESEMFLEEFQGIRRNRGHMYIE